LQIRTLRVNMDFSRKLISLNELNVTVTLSLTDTEDGTYLSGNCVLELIKEVNIDENNSRQFQVWLIPKTGKAVMNFNVIKELNI